ncbi:hypothetical protein B0H13DRAFT_2344679 [Mycena leptocephala]|nr:hypothetical protein B0H13DRAFT_2344679 [Mycena leptocephala]
MANRMRRQSPEDTSRSHSSDSQSGMADTDDPEGMSPYSETSPPPVVPLKKKRTRTLTTPHQSAVLHALLAQSRFPTRAMREEVGRSIGLSARKVQIWFQNQRQKARRPGSQSDTSQPGAPHYNSFPNAPSSYPSTSEYSMSHGERLYSGSQNIHRKLSSSSRTSSFGGFSDADSEDSLESTFSSSLWRGWNLPSYDLPAHQHILRELVDITVFARFYL